MSDPVAPVAVVAAVLERDGRYLVCRRPAHKRHGALWEFPGGKVRAEETREDAVRRELAEELELDALDVGPTLYSTVDEGSPFVIDFVETRAEGTPVLHEHSEAGWFTAAELRAVALAPADARFSAWLSERPGSS